MLTWEKAIVIPHWSSMVFEMMRRYLKAKWLRLFTILPWTGESYIDYLCSFFVVREKLLVCSFHATWSHWSEKHDSWNITNGYRSKPLCKWNLWGMSIEVHSVEGEWGFWKCGRRSLLTNSRSQCWFSPWQLDGKLNRFRFILQQLLPFKSRSCTTKDFFR